MNGITEILVVTILIISIFFWLAHKKKASKVPAKYDASSSDQFIHRPNKIALEKKSKVCPKCYGSGKIICRWCGGSGKKTCGVCGGSGRRFVGITKFNPSGFQNCLFCFAGRTNCACVAGKITCPSCRGTRT